MSGIRELPGPQRLDVLYRLYEMDTGKRPPETVDTDEDADEAIFFYEWCAARLNKCALTMIGHLTDKVNDLQHDVEDLKNR